MPEAKSSLWSRLFVAAGRDWIHARRFRPGRFQREPARPGGVDALAIWQRWFDSCLAFHSDVAPPTGSFLSVGVGLRGPDRHGTFRWQTRPWFRSGRHGAIDRFTIAAFHIDRRNVRVDTSELRGAMGSSFFVLDGLRVNRKEDVDQSDWLENFIAFSATARNDVFNSGECRARSNPAVCSPSNLTGWCQNSLFSRDEKRR